MNLGKNRDLWPTTRRFTRTLRDANPDAQRTWWESGAAAIDEEKRLRREFNEEQRTDEPAWSVWLGRIACGAMFAALVAYLLQAHP